MFYNEISVGAQAENVEQLWEPHETSFIGIWNLTFVLPADLLHFRRGYQEIFFSDMAASNAQSRERENV